MPSATPPALERDATPDIAATLEHHHDF